VDAAFNGETLLHRGAGRGPGGPPGGPAAAPARASEAALALLRELGAPRGASD
jgi:hypothetical protein